MEKLVYLLTKPSSLDIDRFAELLHGEAVAMLRQHGAARITLNIADINARIEQDAPGRLMGPWQDVSAVLAFWLDSLDRRSPIESFLQEKSAGITGYLVTESLVQAFDCEWGEGERRPGVTQFGANGKPADVTDEAFYHNWQVLHSAQSFDLHPLRWSYVRNAVARPLTPGAPDYRAIVSEHFHSIEDFTDDSRYFGSQEALMEMIEHMPGFCDLNNMFSLAMSEYYYP